jgi:pimeloyl-ACP methyl ester carboxylesterase
MWKGQKKRRLVSSCVFVLLSLVVLYLVLTAYLYMAQDNMVFHRRGLSGPVPATVDGESIENIELPVGGSNCVRGWLRRTNHGEKQRLVIYFGGNAEEVSHLLYDPAILKGWSLALTNYRGYGQSDGKPEEKALFEDSLQIYDYYANRNDMDKDCIVVMGRSLGTGVATFLASKRQARAVILISPYDSLADVAKRQYPFVPVDLILKHRFDSCSYAPSVKAPVLGIIGSTDTVIRPGHSFRLLRKWGGPTEVHKLTGLGHNGLLESPETWQCIEKFLEKISDSAPDMGSRRRDALLTN